MVRACHGDHGYDKIEWWRACKLPGCGGTANAQTVEAGFKIILKDANVKAILINIFGGIVRCDRVAQGVIDAYKNLGNIHIPIIVRLQGTNAEEAKKLIDESGLKVQSAILLSEAAELVKKAVA
jgi:succinyl-CoA synthetase beta subunit